MAVLRRIDTVLMPNYHTKCIDIIIQLKLSN